MAAADPVAVVCSNSAAFSRMDVDAMLDHYSADAEVVDHRRVSLGTFRGHDELRAYYLSIFHSASELHEELRVVGERDGVVVADCALRGRLAAAPVGSADVEVLYGLVLDVRDDGRIARLDLYESGEDALAASGLGA